MRFVVKPLSHFILGNGGGIETKMYDVSTRQGPNFDGSLLNIEQESLDFSRVVLSLL